MSPRPGPRSGGAVGTRWATGVLALVLGLSAVSCTSDDVPTPAETEAPTELRISAPVTRVAGRLSDADRLALRRDVEDLLRQYVQEAFLDPEASPRTAYGVFTDGAARLARRRGALLWQADLEAEEVRVRRVRAAVNAYAPAGRAVGATVRLDLVLEAVPTDDDVERVRLTGRLLVTPVGDAWRVFGFDLRRSRR